MNRGRRRGGPGLSGLKDGVKRRLFDPHLVPTKPDPKYEINRLIPLATCKPFIRSYLDDLRCPEASVFPPASEDPSDSSDKLYNSLFKTKAIFELAFRNGPFYHPLPVLRDGIDTALAFGGLTSNEKATEPTAPILLSHLLLAHDDINQWSNGEFLSDLDNMDSFYPKDLVQFTKPGRRPAARMRERLKRRAKMAVPDIPIAVPDLDDLVPDLPPQQDAEVVEEKDEDPAEVPNDDKAQEDNDSEDARWNGEVNVDADPDELDEDELGNDYCQTYFDNGEGDLSDDGLGGDDDDAGARYYD